MQDLLVNNDYLIRNIYNYLEIVKKNVGDDIYLQAKSATVIETSEQQKNASTQQQMVGRSTNNRAQLILEMSNEISEKNAIIKRLEETIVRHDRQFAQFNVDSITIEQSSSQITNSQKSLAGNKTIQILKYYLF